MAKSKVEIVTVRFENVGPSKRSWTAVMTAPLTAEKMIRAIHKQHALGSRGIEFSEEREDCWGGSIYVGVFRKVGAWHVIEEAGGNQRAQEPAKATSASAAQEKPSPDLE